MDTVYLKINDIEFANKVVVNNQILNLLPSEIIPSIEVLKNSERSLNGTLNVDIIAVVTNIKIVFDIFGNDEFEFIRGLLKNDNNENIENIDPDGLKVEYFDFCGTKAKKTIKCFADGMSFTPFIMEGKLMWRDVTIELQQTEVD